MKRQLFFMALAGLFSSIASAADLYVRDLGAGGAYSSISAAITAAANGDRIIIRPKAGSLPYIENLTIDKSLTFVSEINFSKYILQGTLTVTPAAGRSVTLHNLQISGANAIGVAADTAGGRTTLSIYNSTVGAVNAGVANTTLNMSGCIATGVALNHGRLTGNKFATVAINTTVVDSHPSTDDIEIIANAFSATGNAVYLSQSTYNFRLLNNFIGSGYIGIYTVKNGSTNEITNNVIASTNTSNANYSIAVNSPSGNTGLVSILNNVFYYMGPTFGTFYPVQASGVSCYVYYNVSNYSVTMPSITNSGNNTVASFSLNTTTYTVSGLTANAGSPEDDYADLDLSRNDRGHYGGSHSWANYWPTGVGNKPQVNYLNTPRRIYTGTTEMNATGSGYSK